MPSRIIQKKLIAQKKRRLMKHIGIVDRYINNLFLMTCSKPAEIDLVDYVNLPKKILEKGFLIACRHGCTATARKLIQSELIANIKEGIIEAVKYEQMDTAKNLLN